jgi:hypothetical protein
MGRQSWGEKNSCAGKESQDIAYIGHFARLIFVDSFDLTFRVYSEAAKRYPIDYDHANDKKFKGLVEGMITFRLCYEQLT